MGDDVDRAGATEHPDAQTPEPTAVMGRHARVLPSYFVRRLKGDIKTSLGDVAVAELLGWTRVALPTESLAADIRDTAMHRVQRFMAEILKEPCEVALGSAWEAQMHVDERLMLKAAMAAWPDRRLETLSLKELRVGARGRPGVTYSKLLAVLAKVESEGWAASPSPTIAVRRLRVAGPENLQREEPFNADLQSLVDQALAVNWLDRVEQDDIRLSGPQGAAPAAWLKSMLGQACVPASVRALASRVLEADAMSYDQELADLARAAVIVLASSPSDEKLHRWQSVFSMRYAKLERPPTLQEVGDAFGVTRERARQICARILDMLRSGPAATPALDRVVRMSARAAPCSVDEADTQLRRQLGPTAGLLSALDFAGELGTQAIKVQMSKVRVRMSGKYEQAPILELTGEQRWTQRMLSLAAGECTTIGCSSVLRMAGRMALEEGLALSRDAIVSVVEAAPGFAWLDKENGWFSVGNTIDSGAATRIRKILSVAQEPVSVDEVAEAFACDTRWFRDDDRSLAIPPTFVLQAMAKLWPFVKTLQHTKFLPTVPIDPADTLTALEMMVVKLIERGDGIAPAWHFYEECTAALGLTKMAVSITLACSPILVRFEFGLYALRGRRVEDTALGRARAELAKKSVRTWEGDPSAFRITVSTATLTRNEQYTVPARLHEQVAGRTLPIAGMPQRELRFTPAGFMRGIRTAFPHLQPGQGLEIRVLEDQVEVHLLNGGSASQETGPSTP